MPNALPGLLNFAPEPLSKFQNNNQNYIKKKKRLYEVINTFIVLHEAANMIHRKSLSRLNNYDKKSRNIL
jgi:hypothetical protein